MAAWLCRNANHRKHTLLIKASKCPATADGLTCATFFPKNKIWWRLDLLDVREGSGQQRTRERAWVRTRVSFIIRMSHFGWFGFSPLISKIQVSPIQKAERERVREQRLRSVALGIYSLRRYGAALLPKGSCVRSLPYSIIPPRTHNIITSMAIIKMFSTSQMG